MLDEHLGYVADRVRLEAFRAAIARILRPGDRVADLGCGSGVLGLLCLQAGASHVYAIDSTAMIEVARQTLERAGFADRCTLIHAHSHRATLPGPVDVVICDHVGYFGFDYDIAHTLQDARRRLLAPGGRMIPGRIGLEVAAIESNAARTKVDRWRTEGVPQEFHWLRRHAANAKHAVELPLHPWGLLAPVVALHALGAHDLATGGHMETTLRSLMGFHLLRRSLGHRYVLPSRVLSLLPRPSPSAGP